MASVKLPTQPSAEISASAGLRKTIADINFDLGATYFLYPGETSVGGAKVSITGRRPFGRTSGLPKSSHIAGGFAYSPNVSNTGAWGAYAAGGVGVEVPSPVSSTGHCRIVYRRRRLFLVRQSSPQFGGFPLPAYLNWQFGVTFTRKVFNLDLRYYDTNLSRENCFVLTGDPNARPGGAINPVSNP